MKHFLLIIATLFAAASFIASCSSTQTYAEQRQKELDAISNWIARKKITVISSEDFVKNGYVTDTAKNEFVLFKNTGVYMQIINKGTDGKPIGKNENATVLSRFMEYNLNGSTDTKDSLQCANTGSYYITTPDIYTVRNTSGTYSASFVSGAMYYVYGSTSVPGGWLVPLKYINVGRGDNKFLKKADGTDSLDAKGQPIPGSVARVNIIVPHDQGSTVASSNVYACFYTLTYQLADSKQ